jgi:hypothetical protein
VSFGAISRMSSTVAGWSLTMNAPRMSLSAAMGSTALKNAR